jgi:hypothetical protein
MSKKERAAADKKIAEEEAAPRGPEVWDEISKDLGPGTPASKSVVEDAEAAGLLGPEGEPGTADVGLQEHEDASLIREEQGVSGKHVQSAHIGATSFLKKKRGYKRGRADTVLLERDIHRAFDQYWKDWAIAQREAGRKDVSVGEMYKVMLEAIDQIPDIPQRMKNAIAWRLELELFRDLRLKHTDRVTLPYPNVKKKKK